MASPLTQNQQQLSKYCKAFAHPVRVFIMELLSTQEACHSGELHEELGIAKSTLSQHLKELKKVGLIKGTTEGLRIRYCIDATGWSRVAELFNAFAALSVKSNSSDCCG